MNLPMNNASDMGRFALSGFRSLFLAGIVSVAGLFPASAAYFYIPIGTSEAQMQSTINSAEAGDSVVFLQGSHSVTQALVFKDGVTIRGDFSGTTTLDASALPVALEMTQTNLKDCTITGLRFYNVRITLAGNTSHTGNVGNRIDQCTFQKVKSPAMDRIVAITYGRDNIISNCDIQRELEAYPGKGVVFYKTHEAQLLNSRITGYLVTALNISGFNPDDENDLNRRCVQCVVDGNYISRRDTALEDHGIYAASYYDLKIRNNTVKYWSATASGGAIKARNGDDLVIEGNILHESGILLYVYDNALPMRLADVKISGNTFYMSTGAGGYPGIFYYRTTDLGTESSICVSNNVVYDALIQIRGRYGAVSDDFNLDGGGVMDNQLTFPLGDALDIPTNVTVSGNSEITNPDHHHLFYEWWANEHSLVPGVNNAYADDPDSDGMENLTEYALGANPNIADAEIFLPEYGSVPAGGTNLFGMVYRRRFDHAYRGLSYAVNSTANLLDPMTNTVPELGWIALDSDFFDSATNRVSMDQDSLFMQLEITLE